MQDIVVRVFIALLLALSTAAGIYLFIRLRGAESDREHLKRQSNELSARVKSLSRFEYLDDLEDWANGIRSDAQRDAEQVRVTARRQSEEWQTAAVAMHAQAEVAAKQRLEETAVVCDNMIKTAEGQARQGAQQIETVAAQLRAEAQQWRDGAAAVNDRAEKAAVLKLDQSRRESDRIIQAAREEAHRIAGDALLAKDNADRYQGMVQSMRNILEGYGNRYIVPATGLLDELADGYSFADAGQELKAARERTRKMIHDESAATCDYVEPQRKATAVSFVVDAFNGKVDSILADVKDNNFGTLQRKIIDAFNLVNFNGAAFRNARIRPEYLDARQQELRWAVAAQELRLKEREEQRQLKERIREEQRAQREFERAMKEAQKEEELLHKAMEKAQREIEKATGEQRAKYESQLAALAERLKTAEEKNQRALSLAQQTRSGHVYVISNIGSFGEHVYKIGMTRRLEPLDRVRELGDASVPFEFDVHAMISSDDAPTLERTLHKAFLRHQMNKVNPRKEFFRVDLSSIRAEVDKSCAQASWTMTAACREWQETQAIEKAMTQKAFNERAWEEQQMREREVVLEETDEPAAVA